MRVWKERFHVFYKYKDLLIQLVTKDLKLKYRRSILGYVWSILNPLLIMIVISFVFSKMFNRNIENYPVYLIAGRTLFEFNSTATNGAMRSVIGNGALMKKTYVPKYIFPLARVTSSLIDSFFSMGALVIVMIFTRASVSWHILLAPIIMVQIYLFSLGLGFFLSAINVFFRDVQYIYHAFVTAWMYATPLFYDLESIAAASPQVAFIIEKFNPLYYYIQSFRDVVYYGRFPTAWNFWMGWVIAGAALIIGLVCFKKKQDQFILYI